MLSYTIHTKETLTTLRAGQGLRVLLDRVLCEVDTLSEDLRAAIKQMLV